MATIKEIFEKAENSTLTYEQFEQEVKSVNAKFVDLSGGEYVSKHKYDDDIAARDTQLTTLNETLLSRDNDLKSLQEQLEAASKDSSKLGEVDSALKELQKKYKTDTESYQQQLQAQAYEFAVKEFAAKQDFTSKAAKKSFVKEMIDANLQMNEKGIMGAMDFLTAYKEENADSFKVSEPEPNPAPNTPKFAASTNPSPTPEKKTLSDLMKMKNDNPDAVILFN